MNKSLESLFNISDKRILITGASGYFGRYMAETFLEVGAKVLLLSRSENLPEQISRYQDTFGQSRVGGFQIDFYERENLRDTFTKVQSQYEIDVLVNNAYDLSPRTGFNVDEGRLENASFQMWESAFESGIYWAVLACQIIGEQFKKKQVGSIINIGSMYGVVAPNPDLYTGTDLFNPPTYSVQKAGIVALTRYIASCWGRYNIRCNAISPGPFPNVEIKSSNSVESQEFLDRLKSNTVLNRVGHPRDLSGLLIYLASDCSSFMTGQNCIIDGGWTIT